jgi:hypothetical protein
MESDGSESDDNGVYEGERHPKSGLAHGKGKMTFGDGDVVFIGNDEEILDLCLFSIIMTTNSSHFCSFYHIYKHRSISKW